MKLIRTAIGATLKLRSWASPLLGNDEKAATGSSVAAQVWEDENVADMATVTLLGISWLPQFFPSTIHGLLPR